MAAFGGHLFYDLFLQDWGGHGPLAPPGSATVIELKIRGAMMSSLLNTISLVIIVITFETVKNDGGTQKQLFDIVAWKQHDSLEAMQQIDPKSNYNDLHN